MIDLEASWASGSGAGDREGCPRVQLKLNYGKHEKRLDWKPVTAK